MNVIYLKGGTSVPKIVFHVNVGRTELKVNENHLLNRERVRPTNFFGWIRFFGGHQDDKFYILLLKLFENI